jgi:hypothetical protein
MRLFPFIHRDSHDEITRDLRSIIDRQEHKLERSISPEHHHAVVSVLEQRIADLEKRVAEAVTERHDVLDHTMKISFGRPIFKQPDPPPPVAGDGPIETEDEHARLVKEARKHGFTSPRAIAQYVTERNEQRYRDNERRRAIPIVPRAPAAEDESAGAEAAKDDFNAAVREGHAAAQQAVAAS